jgi:hypothetical protein
MTEITPLVRIALYILAGWLSARGLPPQAATILTTDPAMIELATQAIAGAITALALTWWRIAKRLGWST